MRHRLRSFAASLSVASLFVLASGCSSGGDASLGETSESEGALTDTSCPSTDRAIFFHGLQGYGREIRGPALCVPDITSFSGDQAFIQGDSTEVVGGYSAGRLLLIRRISRGDMPESKAVLLDPSWADGARFDGRTGPSIVEEWLSGDPNRRFYLVYLASSAGWREYDRLVEGPYGAQVKSCRESGAGHFELPRRVGRELFLDPEGWFRERCSP